MTRRLVIRTAGVAAVLVLAGSLSTLAQQPPGAAGGRQGGRGRGAAPATLVMKVEWQSDGRTGSRPGVPNQVPVMQTNLADQNLELAHLGAGKQLLTANNDPSSVWSGECEAPFAITFRHKGHYMDLTGNAKVRWITKTSGFHVVRPVLTLADGTVMVGDFASMNVPMLAMTEFPIATIRWVRLDPARVVTLGSPGNANNEVWVQNPDLSRVDEFGFADLMPASGHGTGGYIHVGSIEVYGRPVPREGAPSSSR